METCEANQQTASPHVPLPPGWPESVRFTSEYELSDEVRAVTGTLPPVEADAQRRQSLAALYRRPYAAPFAHIRSISDPLHPANGQLGLFASTMIQCNTHIVDYVGLVISADSPRIQASDYVLDMTGYSVASGETILRLAIDGELVGNEGRMVNDSRGVPCENATRYDRKSKKAVKKAANPEYAHFADKSKPNVEFRSYVDVETRQLRMALFCCAAAGIRPGEELLISYGKGYWISRGLDLSEMHQHSAALIQ